MRHSQGTQSEEGAENRMQMMDTVASLETTAETGYLALGRLQVAE